MDFPGNWRTAIRRRSWLLLLGEVLLIGLWALWVGRAYLDLNPRVVPAGREFLSAIQTHHFWMQVQECGWCALWNGSVQGGYPALADVHGSLLHPLVMITTLIWDVINGAKIALILSLWLAGVAQWWLAREMELGWAPRLWSAFLAVAAGHLSGRMELGAFGVVLSTAMCSLVFPAVLAVARKGGRTIVLLALVLASAAVAGQGYIQVGLIFGLPLLALLSFQGGRPAAHVGRDLLVATALALLLASPFLIPLGHFLPNFVKEADPTFHTAQPLRYMPLNLVIEDPVFYFSGALHKLPYPHLNTLFIGWVAVALAVCGLALAKARHRLTIGVLARVAAIEFLVASSVFLKWGVKLIPALGGVRHPTQIAGLAVPPILALAAYGLQRLLDLSWPELSLRHAAWPKLSGRAASLRWILLVPLLLNLHTALVFSGEWLKTNVVGENVYELLESLRTPSLEWVEPPFGEHFYIEPAVSMGLKLSPGIRTWVWKNREPPPALLEANRVGPPDDSAQQIGEVDGIPIYRREGEFYAGVVEAEGVETCQASGSGGSLDVVCDNSAPGTLLVKEYVWSGWRAWRDGETIPLLGRTWIQVEAPAGHHVYQFRYLPWDVPLGLALLLLGLAFSLWLCCRPIAKQNLEVRPETG